jgi:alpha,alpha-trehalase
LANLYQVWGNETQNNNTNSNATAQSAYHQEAADNLTAAALDLHWDPEKAWFYDYNTTSSNRTDIFGPHGTFALWQNITPPELYNNETLGLKMVSGWRYLLGKYAGIPSPATLIAAGLNWDFPNAWPPHACESTPNIRKKANDRYINQSFRSDWKSYWERIYSYGKQYHR